MEPIGAHLRLMSVQITASVSASANNSVSASANNDDAQISNCANTICSHYKPPEGVMLWVHCSCDSSCPTETHWNSFDCRNTITSCVHCSCDSSCFNWSPLDCSHVNCVPHVNSQMCTLCKANTTFCHHNPQGVLV